MALHSKSTLQLIAPGIRYVTLNIFKLNLKDLTINFCIKLLDCYWFGTALYRCKHREGTNSYQRRVAGAIPCSRLDVHLIALTHQILVIYGAIMTMHFNSSVLGLTGNASPDQGLGLINCDIN